MGDDRFDVLVVGAGPAGAVCALLLARGGAKVALVDKARFPRDKACGDLVGPLGLRVLEDIGIDLGDRDGEAWPSPGDMLVVGPTGTRVRLPAAPGLTYPGRATALPRERLDSLLREHAVRAGATAIEARAAEPLTDRRGLSGFSLDNGHRVAADFVIGADGATSRVAEAADLVDPTRVLWGFAVRSYVEQKVDLPTIVMWETGPRRLLRGYGWIFPGASSVANAGLGVGTLGDRKSGAEAVRLLPAFFDHLHRIDLLSNRAPPRGRLGGWLKMGMVGTRPASGQVLLVGDAAGLVNPLQGEGIAHAMTSGRAAAESVLADPGGACSLYMRRLRASLLPYNKIAASAHAVLVSRPRAASYVCRLLTHPVLSGRLAAGWAVFWNELLEGASPGTARDLAAAATAIGRAAASLGPTARWFDGTFPAL